MLLSSRKCLKGEDLDPSKVKSHAFKIRVKTKQKAQSYVCDVLVLSLRNAGSMIDT